MKDVQSPKPLGFGDHKIQENYNYQRNCPLSLGIAPWVKRVKRPQASWSEGLQTGWPPLPLPSHFCSTFHGKFHGQRSLAGYSPWGHKELDTTEHPWTNGHVSNFFQILILLEYQLSLNFKRSLMNTTGFTCPTSHFLCEVFFHLDFPEFWVILVFIYFPWLKEILWATQTSFCNFVV